MIGTIVNVGTIVTGSLVGSLVKNGIKERYHKTMLNAVGLVAIALGVSWIGKNLPNSEQPLLFVFAMITGGFVGEFIDIDEKFNKIGEKLAKNSESESMEGLITAILLFCMGTLSILGPLESALRGDHTLLFTNAILDGFTSLILASNFGISIIFSALFLFVWQGAIYLGASSIESIVSAQFLIEISVVGGILIMSTGLNVLKIVKIKTLNMLPAILISGIYFIPGVKENILNLFSFLN